MGIKTGICVLLLLCGLVAAQEDVAKQGECMAGQMVQPDKSSTTQAKGR